MARSKNSLTDVGPASGQLKNSFSYLEKTQLNALKNSTSSIGYGAGGINGDITNSMRNFSYRDRGKLEIGGLFAEGLEKSGITQMNSGATISSIIGSSIDNRKPFYRNTPSKEIDLSISSNRVPDPNKKSAVSAIKEKRESLVGRGDEGYEGYTFPGDLKQNAHAYMHLMLWSYKRPTSFLEGKVEPGMVNIYLPLPEGFTQEFSVNYGEQETGVIGAALRTKDGSDALSTFVSNYREGAGLGGTIVEAAKTVDFGSVAGYAGLSTLSSANPAIGGLVSQEIGQIANPHPSLFLQGVNLRTYTLAWKMVPRYEGEAQTIKNILKVIKRDCLPKKKGSFLTYPKLIEPKIMNADFGQDYKKSMLTGLSINYAAEGTSAFFYDGNPVAIEMSLELQEAELYLEEVESE